MSALYHYPEPGCPGSVKITAFTFQWDISKTVSIYYSKDKPMESQNIRAFFLGTLTAERPMPFHKAVDEIFVAAPEDKAQFEADLKKEWDSISTNLKTEMINLMDDKGMSDIDFLKVAQENLDYYLTGLSLSGTTMETSSDEDFSDLLDEMEDVVLDLEEYIMEEKFEATETKEFKEVVQSLWTDMIEARSL